MTHNTRYTRGTLAHTGHIVYTYMRAYKVETQTRFSFFSRYVCMEYVAYYYARVIKRNWRSVFYLFLFYSAFLLSVCRKWLVRSFELSFVYSFRLLLRRLGGDVCLVFGLMDAQSDFGMNYIQSEATETWWCSLTEKKGGKYWPLGSCISEWKRINWIICEDSYSKVLVFFFFYGKASGSADLIGCCCCCVFHVGRYGPDRLTFC